MALTPGAIARRAFIEQAASAFNSRHGERWPLLTPNEKANFAIGSFRSRERVYPSVDIRLVAGVDVSIFFIEPDRDEQVLEAVAEAAAQAFPDSVGRRVLNNGTGVLVRVPAASGFGPGSGVAERAADTLARLMEVAEPIVLRLMEVAQPSVSDDQPATGAGRNPSWTRDEVILALALYVRHGGEGLSKTDPEIVALSETLNSLQRSLGFTGDTLRNANGVSFKIENLRRFDPKFAGRRGLPNGGAIEQEVWETFASDPTGLAAVAAAIRSALAADTTSDPLAAHTGELDGIAEAVEGRAMTVRHIRRERSPKLVKRKKASEKRRLGRLACEACGFDFLATYGERGADFIECHHTRPVSEMVEGGTTRLEDLVLACSNCHRMIHAKRPWLTIAELRDVLRDSREGGGAAYLAST